MPYYPCCNNRRSSRRRRAVAGAAAAAAAAPITMTTIVTDELNCCTTPETVAEELYNGVANAIVARSCCDSVLGCTAFDTRARCNFWPRFAHPRWLTCSALHNRIVIE